MALWELDPYRLRTICQWFSGTCVHIIVGLIVQVTVGLIAQIL